MVHVVVVVIIIMPVYKEARLKLDANLNKIPAKIGDGEASMRGLFAIGHFKFTPSPAAVRLENRTTI